MNSQSADRRWSIGLLVDETELGPLSKTEIVQTIYTSEVVHGLTIGWSVIDHEEDRAGIKLIVSAPDDEAATARAQNLIFQARRAAKLPTAVVPIAWVMPLREGTESSDRFLDQAKDLLTGETPELAVVAAHIHLEVQVKALLEHVAIETGKEVNAQAWGMGNLNNGRCREAIRALMNLDVMQSPHWPEFDKSALRRNAIVHEGEPVSEEHARATLAMVQGLVAELAEAAGLPGVQKHPEASD